MATIDAPNTTTLAEGALQPTTTEQDKSRKVISLIDTLLTTPEAPTGTVVEPVTQEVQSGEALETKGVEGTLAAAQPTAGVIPTITAATAPTATTVGGQTAATPASMTAQTVAGATPTMTAQTGTVTAPMTAQTGTVTSDATVRGQLANITSDIETSLASGNALPAYLRGVANATKAAMQARGLGSSTMMA